MNAPHGHVLVARLDSVGDVLLAGLERLADGLGALEKRKTWGKVIVRIRDEQSGARAKL